MHGGLRVVVVPAGDHDLGAVGLDPGDLRLGCRLGDEHLRPEAEPRCDVRHGDAVVPARSGDHAGRRHLVRQHPVVRAPGLERARVLQALQLQRDRGVDLEAEVAGVDDERRRDPDMRSDALGGVFDVAAIDRHLGHRVSLARSAPDYFRSVSTEERPVAIEPRWPLVLVLFGFIALTIFLRVVEPEREHLGPPWMVPAVEIGLLFALLAADPMHLARRTKWLRPLAITLIVTLMAIVFVSDAILIRDLIEGAKITESPSALLASGALVWAGNASCSASSTGSSTTAGRSPATAGPSAIPTSPSRSS